MSLTTLLVAACSTTVIISEALIYHGRDGATVNAVAWLGKEVQLQCHVEEKNLQLLVWKKNEQLISVGTMIFAINLTNIRLLSETLLQISPVKEKDSGLYLCQPGNKVNEEKQQKFNLHVQEFLCSELESPKHGTITYSGEMKKNGYPNGTIASYECDEGFGIPNFQPVSCCDCFGGWNATYKECIDNRTLAVIELEKKMATRLQEILNGSMNALGQQQQSLREKMDNLTSYQMSWQQTMDERLNLTLKRFDQLQREQKNSAHRSHKDITNRLQLLESRAESLASLTGEQSAVSKKFDQTLQQLLKTDGAEANATNGQSANNYSNFWARFGLKKLVQLVNRWEQMSQHNEQAYLWEELQKQTVARMQVVGGNAVLEYLWLVHNIDAKIGRINTLQDSYLATQSNFFYTNIPGYRMRLVLYPDFEKSGYIGLFAGLSNGDYDDYLTWPFKYDYHLAILSHVDDVKDHVGMIELPSNTCDSKKFFRPKTKDVPTACGFRHFMSHALLYEKRQAFETRGHVWIRIRIFL